MRRLLQIPAVDTDSLSGREENGSQRGAASGYSPRATPIPDGFCEPRRSPGNGCRKGADHAEKHAPRQTRSPGRYYGPHAFYRPALGDQPCDRSARDDDPIDHSRGFLCDGHGRLALDGLGARHRRAPRGDRTVDEDAARRPLPLASPSRRRRDRPLRRSLACQVLGRPDPHGARRAVGPETPKFGRGTRRVRRIVGGPSAVCRNVGPVAHRAHDRARAPFLPEAPGLRPVAHDPQTLLRRLPRTLGPLRAPDGCE